MSRNSEHMSAFYVVCSTIYKFTNYRLKGNENYLGIVGLEYRSLYGRLDGGHYQAIFGARMACHTCLIRNQCDIFMGMSDCQSRDSISKDISDLIYKKPDTGGGAKTNLKCVSSRASMKTFILSEKRGMQKGYGFT